MTIEEKQYHLNTILNAIQEIESYADGMEFNQFSKAEGVKGIMAMNFQVIGQEALLCKDFVKEEFSQFDFEVLERLKDVGFVSENEMDLRSLHFIIKEDLPIIRDQINQISEKLSEEVE